MLTVRGPQHSFSTHERMFLWKCQSFWDRKCLDLRGTRTPNLRIHAECSKLFKFKFTRTGVLVKVSKVFDRVASRGRCFQGIDTSSSYFILQCRSISQRKPTSRQPVADCGAATWWSNFTFTGAPSTLRGPNIKLTAPSSLLRSVSVGGQLPFRSSYCSLNSLVPARCGSNHQACFSNSFYELIYWTLSVKLVLGKCHWKPLILIRSQHCFSWMINDLMPSDNKPLLEPMLTKISLVI